MNDFDSNFDQLKSLFSTPKPATFFLIIIQSETNSRMVKLQPDPKNFHKHVRCTPESESE